MLSFDSREAASRAKGEGPPARMRYERSEQVRKSVERVWVGEGQVKFVRAVVG